LFQGLIFFVGRNSRATRGKTGFLVIFFRLVLWKAEKWMMAALFFVRRKFFGVYY